MHLFNEQDLFRLLKNERLFSLFTLLEREEFILRAHELHGHTFLSIGALLKMSDSRAHFIYKRAIKKIKNQSIEILEQEWEHRNKKRQAATSKTGYIAGDGEAWNGTPENAPHNLSVLAVGLKKVG